MASTVTANQLHTRAFSTADDWRLVVMSNRAPIRIVRDDNGERIEPTVGGVGTSFLKLLEHHGGIWVAWSGSKGTPGRVALPTNKPRFSIRFVPLTERDISNYYYGTCNRGLWPLLHLMPQHCHFDSRNWNYYQRVNQSFADAAAGELNPGDVVWIQDFHLALVPSLLRQRHLEAPVGLFWHVPFPPQPIFSIFPWRKELLAGMLGSDLVGFHCRSYADYFLSCCEHVLGLDVDRTTSEVLYGNRTIKVGAFPIGIPADYFAELADNPRVRARAQRIRRALASPFIVLGVDRLDYTKGLLMRLLGFERFLEQYPEYRRRVTMVQIAVPSRTRVNEYIRLKRELDELVGRIIGRFSSAGWVPLRYLYNQFDAEELVSYYRAADAALLTPLRDGMNLVAKEYVASRSNDDGVLILSEFTGAAEELTEALLVNPYDIDQIAYRLKQAIEMDPKEVTERMRAMRETVKLNNLERWSAAFLGALASHWEENRRQERAAAAAN